MGVAVGGLGRPDTPVASAPVVVPPLMSMNVVAESPTVPEVEETPAKSKLNPMGLDKRVADTTAAGPSPMVPQFTPAVPMPMPAARTADDKIAEGLNDPNPMGDPAIGMMTSKL